MMHAGNHNNLVEETDDQTRDTERQLSKKVVAFSTTSSREWNTGPIANRPSVIITSKVKNGVTIRSMASGMRFRKNLSNLAPSSPMKNAGRTEP